MALGVRGEIRRSQHYTTLCWAAGRVSHKGVRKSLCPVRLFQFGLPKILELLMLHLPLSTVEGISSGIRGTLGGRRGGFPTGSEQQVPGASNLGYRPTRQTASYAPAPANQQTALALLPC